MLPDLVAIWPGIAESTVVVPEGGIGSIELVLEPAASIVGRVETESGDAVVGATVQVQSGGIDPLVRASVRSDTDGNFQLHAVRAGSVMLEVETVSSESLTGVVETTAGPIQSGLLLSSGLLPTPVPIGGVNLWVSAPLVWVPMTINTPRTQISSDLLCKKPQVCIEARKQFGEHPLSIQPWIILGAKPTLQHGTDQSLHIVTSGDRSIISERL